VTEIPTARVLYIVGCAAPPILKVADGIGQAQARGWDVCLILTPTAALWLEDSLEELAALTGHPVRQRYKLPGQPDVLPPADAVLVAPATFNMINKWAAGTADTLALGMVTEGIGMGLPLVTLPHLNAWQAAHSAFPRSVDQLRADGVQVLIDESDGNTPHVPGSPGPRPAFPWVLGLDALEDVRRSRT
jgi:hypothetical protein